MNEETEKGTTERVIEGSLEERSAEACRELYRRIGDFRKDILTQDWEDDKNFVIGSTLKFKYISVDKMKRNLAPLFVKHGLDLSLKFYDLKSWPAVGQMSQHWTIQLDVKLTDISTGASETSTVFGEAADSGDKGVFKAQAGAIKQWAFSKFFIADGYDPLEEPTPAVGKFRPLSDDEEAEAKAKIAKHAVKPKAPAKETPKKAPASAPVASKTESKATTSSKPVKADSEPVKATKEEAPKKGKIPAPIMNTMDNIVEKWNKAAKEGKISVEKYNAMSSARIDVSSGPEAADFIKKFMKVE